MLVLDNYVLAAIGELPEDKATGMISIVQPVFGGGDDWMQTIRETLQLDEGLDDSLRQMWAKNQQIAQDESVPLSPLDFAAMIVDENFAELIETL